MQLISAAATDVGRHRDNNEDAFFCGDTLFAVADGLGGHNAGEVASSLAISILRQAPESNIARAFDAANRYILSESRDKPMYRGMATTLTALHFFNDRRVLLAHVGDSACYRLRDGRAEKLSKDQTVAEQLRDAGEIPPKITEGVLTNCIGSDKYSGPICDMHTARPLDVFLLCSDGLSDYLEDPQVLMALLTEVGRDPRELPKACVEHALQSGGHDNVTVVAIGVAS